MLSPHLNVTDYDGIFRALGLLYGRVIRIDDLAHHAHGVLKQFIPCDNWTYVERHIASNRARGVVGYSVSDFEMRFRRYFELRRDYHFFDDTSPAHRGHVRSISDFLSWPRYRETAMYREAVCAGGYKHSISVSPRDLTGECVLTFSLARDGAYDFSEREKAFMEVVRPHLLRIHEIARLRTLNAGLLPSIGDLRGLQLTYREAEVLHWVAQGKSNSEIGSIIGKREQTVKNHLHSIFIKLGVENRAAAIVTALRVPRRYVPCEIGVLADPDGKSTHDGGNKFPVG